MQESGSWEEAAEETFPGELRDKATSLFLEQGEKEGIGVFGGETRKGDNI